MPAVDAIYKDFCNAANFHFPLKFAIGAGIWDGRINQTWQAHPLNGHPRTHAEHGVCGTDMRPPYFITSTPVAPYPASPHSSLIAPSISKHSHPEPEVVAAAVAVGLQGALGGGHGGVLAV